MREFNEAPEYKPGHGSGWIKSMENMLPSCSCGGKAYIEYGRPYYWVHCRRCYKSKKQVRTGAADMDAAVIEVCSLWEGMINGKK